MMSMVRTGAVNAKNTEAFYSMGIAIFGPTFSDKGGEELGNIGGTTSLIRCSHLGRVLR